MPPSVSTEIDIAAPPNAVWAVLTDYDRYPEWNPFMVKISGDKEVGGRLTVSVKPPNSGSGMTFSPAIQIFLPNEHLQWEARLLGVTWLLTGQHRFILRPIETGTRFEQSERFSGILASVLYWIGFNMNETTQRHFGLMNKALRERVEGRSLPDPALKQRVESSVKADGLSDA